MIWTHFNPVNIIAGCGVRKKVASFLPAGEILLITSAGMVQRGTATELTKSCPTTKWKVCTISPNPALDELDTLADNVREKCFSAVVALGGGSAIDSAKALATILPVQHTQVLNQWLRSSVPDITPVRLPLVCLPTTSGTGAEVTPFATIWDTKEQIKRSLAGSFLYPSVALLDPELTISLPWKNTLDGGLDAASHALESLWNRNVTPISATLAEKSLRLIVEFLPLLEQQQKNMIAREALQQASVLSGLAISQNRTAIAHSISYPLTLTFNVPHGLACGFSLLSIIELVTKAKAWRIDVDLHLQKRVYNMLQGFNLPKQMRQYCTRKQALEQIGGMFTQSRADNFVLDLNKAMVENILLNCLDE